MKITNIDSLTPYTTKGRLAGMGTTAVCYKIGDKLLKKYINTIGTKNMFIYIDDMLEQLKLINEIQNDTYIGPEEVLVKNGIVVGYIYPYINGPTFRHISGKTHMSSLFNNFDKLIEDTNKVSEYGFKLLDLHDKNILFDGEYYYVIDLDKGKLIDGVDDPIAMARNVNIRSVHDTIGFSIFKTKPWEIMTFGDKDIQNMYYHMDWTNKNSLLDFVDLLGDKCNEKDPTLHKVRSKVRVYREFNSYYKFM